MGFRNKSYLLAYLIDTPWDRVTFSQVQSEPWLFFWPCAWPFSMKKAWKCFIFSDFLYGFKMAVCSNHGSIFLPSHLAGMKSFFPILWKENPELCYSWTTLDLVIMHRKWRSESRELGDSSYSWISPVARRMGFPYWP